MDLELSDKSVLITGASGGIGRALAEEFGAQGCKLFLQGNRNYGGLTKWVAGQAWSANVRCGEADVSDPEDMRRLTKQALDAFGRIDVCVVNAGVWPEESLPLHRMSEDRVRTVLGTNLFGAIWTAQAFLTALKRTGPLGNGQGSSLVFIGSTAGSFGERGHSEYAASKAALVGLVKSLKNEIVDIDPYGRVNLVEPGWTLTHMARPVLEEPGAIAKLVRTMSLRQLARARDIARSVLMLASPALSRHTTGQTLTVAGGMEGRVQWRNEDIDEAAIRRRIVAD